MAEAEYPVYGEIAGPIVMIGFGSIGRGTLPLIERHFNYDRSRMVVVDPRDDDAGLISEHGLRHVKEALTPENFRFRVATAADRGAKARASASIFRSTPRPWTS